MNSTTIGKAITAGNGDVFTWIKYEDGSYCMHMFSPQELDESYLRATENLSRCVPLETV